MTAAKIDNNVPVSSDKFEIPECVLISFDENEMLKNKIMTLFHSFWTSNAVKNAKENIVRVVLKQRIKLGDVRI